MTRAQRLILFAFVAVASLFVDSFGRALEYALESRQCEDACVRSGYQDGGFDRGVCSCLSRSLECRDRTCWLTVRQEELIGWVR